MPVIVNSEYPHPFLPSLGDPSAIDAARALHQDIRPLEILIVNLMADKQATERQLARWLGATPLQINVTFAATDDYVAKIEGGHRPGLTPREHIERFYSAWSAVKSGPFDGMIVTGINALQPRVEQEAFWPEVVKIMEWSRTNVLSSLFLCWGAKAALKYFHDIDSVKGESKIFGLFPHKLGLDRCGLLSDFPDVFSVPVSRWKSPARAAIETCPALEIAADSTEAGPNVLVESAPYNGHGLYFPRRVYLLCHPEYDTDTLAREYARDRVADPAWPLPRHYFPGDDPAQAPLNLWRATGNLYRNWIKTIYQATPYDLSAIPEAADGAAI